MIVVLIFDMNLRLGYCLDCGFGLFCCFVFDTNLFVFLVVMTVTITIVCYMFGLLVIALFALEVPMLDVCLDAWFDFLFDLGVYVCCFTCLYLFCLYCC